MNLQNIVIDFNESLVSSLFDDKRYDVDVLENVLHIEQTFKNAYSVNFTKVVVQLSTDQHGCKPRILCQSENKTEFISILDVATNHPELFLELKNIRTIIEEKITEQLIIE